MASTINGGVDLWKKIWNSYQPVWYIYMQKKPAVSLPSGHQTWRKLAYFWMTFQFKSHLDVISNCHVWLPERRAAIIHYIYLYVIHCLSTSYPLVNPDCCDYTHYCWLVNVSYITIYQHIPLDSNHIPLVIFHVSSTLKTPLIRYQLSCHDHHGWRISIENGYGDE